MTNNGLIAQAQLLVTLLGFLEVEAGQPQVCILLWNRLWLVAGPRFDV